MGDMSNSEEEKWVCTACIGEAYLKSRIKKEGQKQRCSFCRQKATALAFDEIVDAFDQVFEEHLYRTSDQPSDFEYLLMKESDYQWDRSGDPILDVLQEVGEIDEKLAEAIRGELCERHYVHDEFQEEGDFDEDSHYSYRSVSTEELSAAWQTFTENLKVKSRYFSRTAEAILSDLFNGIHIYRTKGSSNLIVKAGPDTNLPALYRARVFQNSERLEEALKRPDLEIGPPPPRLATAGRMNARGIAVFYGAVDAQVARAEVRPFIGSRVVVAKFDISRSLNLLDLDALKSVEIKGNLFDPGYGAKLEKANFLRSLSGRMGAPVMPDDEPFDYLPTQAIADFLATGQNPVLDGIIYPSVQGEAGAKNVVLFHKAALVQKLEIPDGTRVSAQLENMTEDGPEVDYWVWEETPKKSKKKKLRGSRFPARGSGWAQNASLSEDDREVALQIDVTSIEVHHITGIGFKTDDFKVKRHRFEERDHKF
jgi:hypothetical protein